MNNANMALYTTKNTIKRSSKQKWKNMEYHVKHNKDVDNHEGKVYLSTNQIPELQFLVPHNKPHGVGGLGKNYPTSFYRKLGHEIYAIHFILYDCNSFNSILYQPWVTSVTYKQQPHNQPVKNCTYWPVLGYFNNWNNLQLSHKATSSEEFYKLIKFY